MDHNTFIVSEEDDGERLDKLLAVLFPSYSRSFLQKLFEGKNQNSGGSVTLNGRAVKPSTKVRENDVVVFTVPDLVIPDIAPENIPLDILYEDDDVLVVNKPKDMVVHPAPGHYSGTLVNAVLYHCGNSLSGINGVMRPGIVHRIDKDTTGSLIICKNDAAHNSIAEQLAVHSITRSYIAILYGHLPQQEITVDKPLWRDPKDRKKMAIAPEGSGKRAVTHVHVLKEYRDYSYVECRLETGRTHQIRVHMASIGHPILGDEIYAPNKKNPYKLQGQCLHARVLGFVHPVTNAYIEVSAPIPGYFEHLLEIMPQ